MSQSSGPKKCLCGAINGLPVENVIFLQAISVRFIGLSIGFTMRVLNGPINNTVVQSLRVTDVEFVEYEGYHYEINGQTSITTTVEDTLKLLGTSTKAAEMLKTLMNNTILPYYDLKPL